MNAISFTTTVGTAEAGVGRVAIVTGAGNGLGRAYAIELARRGASVVVNDIGGDALGRGSATSPADDVVREIVECGGQAVASYESVATAAGGEAIVNRALERFGRVDIVINNAGILRNDPFDVATDDDLEAVLAVHVKGPIHVSRPAFRVMREQGYGRLVFTSSTAGVFGVAHQAYYAAAKTAMIGLSNVLALEGAPHGIRSNVIMPVARTRLADAAPHTAAPTQSPLEAIAPRLTPEWVVPMVVYLASEACAVTHEVFSAVGGRYARVLFATTDGWRAPTEAPPSVEAIEAHLGTIEDRSNYDVPMSMAEEFMSILR